MLPFPSCNIKVGNFHVLCGDCWNTSSLCHVCSLKSLYLASHGVNLEIYKSWDKWVKLTAACVSGFTFEISSSTQSSLP